MLSLQEGKKKEKNDAIKNNKDSTCASKERA